MEIRVPIFAPVAAAGQSARAVHRLGDVSATSFFRYPQYHTTNANVRTRRATLRAVAGNHTSSLPAPSGERADRARTPRKPASRALVPTG